MKTVSGYLHIPLVFHSLSLPDTESEIQFPPLFFAVSDSWYIFTGEILSSWELVGRKVSSKSPNSVSAVTFHLSLTYHDLCH